MPHFSAVWLIFSSYYLDSPTILVSRVVCMVDLMLLFHDSNGCRGVSRYYSLWLEGFSTYSICIL